MPQASQQYKFLIDKAASDTEACILWPYRLDKYGYGVLKLVGKEVRAHRLAYKLKWGHFPRGDGSHTCHITRCVNWRHVVDESRSENLARSRGTGGRIERRGSLTSANGATGMPA